MLNIRYVIKCCPWKIIWYLYHIYIISIHWLPRYVLYFHKDAELGHQRGGQWSGIVGHVASGKADMVVGAFR